jgi:signal transduction histidine kinase
VRRLQSADGPRIELHASRIPVECLDDGTAYQLLRIAQEAIVNAHRHSRAHSITVSCEHEDGLVKVVVSDDGIGLPADGSTASGIGRHVMEYRAKAIGARLRLTPGLGGGLTVSCELPCPAAEPAGGGTVRTTPA